MSLDLDAKDLSEIIIQGTIKLVDDRISRKRKEIDELDSSLIKKRKEELELSTKLTELGDGCDKMEAEIVHAKKILDRVTSDELFKKKVKLAGEIEAKEKEIAKLDEKRTERKELEKKTKQLFNTSVRRLLENYRQEEQSESDDEEEYEPFECEQIYHFTKDSLFYRGMNYCNDDQRYVDGTNFFTITDRTKDLGEYRIWVTCSASCIMHYQIWIDGKFSGTKTMKKLHRCYFYKKKIAIKIFPKKTK